MQLKIERVWKEFRTKQTSVVALEDINLNIKPGEFVCLVGPSGCGKSTLLNIVAGLDQPTQGTVSSESRILTEPGADRVVMFQEAALFPWLNVIGNVEFGLKGRVDKMKRREIAQTFLKMVHLSRFENSLIHQLSGGMKSRVALARCLALNPQVLLMDEPFAALDAQTRDLLHEELQDIWLATKKTIVFVTHNVREAVRLADRVLVFTARPGKIKKEFRINLAHPRAADSLDVLEYVRQITLELQEEVDQVVKEEMDRDWIHQKARFLQSLDAHLGGDI
jgi:NitT/TauT family transport system ATP-binding protein